jgi:hypothetical protein
MLPGGGCVRMQPMPVDLPQAPTEMPFPPKYGADTRRILAEAGLGAADVDRLVAGGIVA